MCTQRTQLFFLHRGRPHLQPAPAGRRIASMKMLFLDPLETVAGLLTSAITYWVGAVIVLLTTQGIPLGSTSEPLSSLEFLLHVVMAGGACALGAHVALRVTGGWSGSAVAVGLILGVMAFRGFGQHAHNWPRGFPLAMGVACLVGAMVLVGARGAFPR